MPPLVRRKKDGMLEALSDVLRMNDANGEVAELIEGMLDLGDIEGTDDVLVFGGNSSPIGGESGLPDPSGKDPGWIKGGGLRVLEGTKDASVGGLTKKLPLRAEMKEPTEVAKEAARACASPTPART